MVLDALPVLPGIPEGENRKGTALEGKSVQYLKEFSIPGSYPILSNINVCSSSVSVCLSLRLWFE